MTALDAQPGAAASARPAPAPGTPPVPLIEVDRFSLFYGAERVLSEITLGIRERAITAFIGPSGCGKSSLLRCFNRMNDLIGDVRHTGQIRLAGQEIFAPEVDVIALRRQVGMVFQKPNPLPKSIYENVAYGPRLLGLRHPAELDPRVEQSLRQSGLWEEVRDRLRDSALRLSGGQQQRLCVARALAVRPRVLLLDEPAAALDPVAAARIEELLLELRRELTIVIVTHNMQQAARISDFTAFLNVGELVEFGPTQRLFTNPSQPRTEDYVTGRFG